MKKKNKNMSPCGGSAEGGNKGISLVLVILIIGAILFGVLIVADIVVRQAKVTQGFDLSEKAYMAAETGVEEAAYKVNKDFCRVDTTDCNASGALSLGGQYITTLSIDKKEPNTGQTTGLGEDITNSNPWEAAFSTSSSLLLSLDLNSQNKIYPDSITISQNPSGLGELIFWECQTIGSPRTCNESFQTSTTYTTFPQTLNTAPSDSHYYKIRINNTASETVTYTLTPSSDHSLPVGAIIESTGTYQDYERKTKFTLPKWQIFGGE